MSLNVLVCIAIHETIHQGGVGVDINIEIYYQFLEIKETTHFIIVDQLCSYCTADLRKNKGADQLHS